MSFAICSSPDRSDAGELGRWQQPPALFFGVYVEASSRLANTPEAELFPILFAAAREERGVEMVDQNTAIEGLG
jgi:hypothetical protein